MENISNYDEMYIDQEAAQDDDDNMKTAANRPPSPETDVCKRNQLVGNYICEFHFV